MAGPTTGVTHVTNRDLAQFMTAVSDNAAANIFIDSVGKDNVNATLRGLELSKTMLRQKMIDILPGKCSGGEQARRIGGRANGFRHRSRAKSPVCDQRNDCLRPR